MSAFQSQAERSSRQTRHLSYIAEFTTDIQYITGKFNVVADAFSRFNINSNSESEEHVCFSVSSFDQLAQDQVQSGEMDSYRTADTGHSNFKTFSLVHQLCCVIRPLVSLAQFCPNLGPAQCLIKSMDFHM